MKSSAPLNKAAPVALTLTALALTLPVSTLAKKGSNGNGGGGNGGDGGGGTDITINPVPIVLDTPPVDYVKTELYWSGDLNENGIADDFEETFGGVSAVGVNSHGIVVGSIVGPADADPGPYKRYGAVRLDPTSGSVLDLNSVFASSLLSLNQQRPPSEEPWRIVGATRINNDGLITCGLVPESAPERLRPADAAELGMEPTPTLYAVADLNRRDEPDALMLVPISTSPNGDFLDFNELGDVLMFDHDPDADTYLTRLFPLAADNSGTLGYHVENEIPIPALTSWPVNYPSFNAANEVIFRRNSELVRYSSFANEETVLVDSGAYSWFLPNGIANDGTAVISATEAVTTGRGRNQTTTYLDFPVHIISPTERTPLTDPAEDGNASVPHFAWSVSRAAAAGEAEVLIQIEGTLEHQIYKPNLGFRFPVPIVGDVIVPDISPPVDQTITTDWDPATGTGTYAAGFISYSLVEGTFRRAFVLAPQMP